MYALDTTQLVEFYAQTSASVCVSVCMLTFQCSVNDERPRNELAAILPNSVPATASCQLLLLCATDAHCRNSDVMRTRRRHSQPCLPACLLSQCVCVVGVVVPGHISAAVAFGPQNENENETEDETFERTTCNLSARMAY